MAVLVQWEKVIRNYIHISQRGYEYLRADI